MIFDFLKSLRDLCFICRSEQRSALEWLWDTWKLYIPFFLSSLDCFIRKVQNRILEWYGLSFFSYVEMQKWHFEHKTFVL